MTKPFSQACENNKEPIREILNQYLNGEALLLEIGSGTGQHAEYITQHHPNLQWQTSDVAENLAGINAWVKSANRANFLTPIALNISNAKWSQDPVDMLYSANTAHIMHWHEVEKLFTFIPSALKNQGYFLLYGPFNYNGAFTSESNERFNQWLISQAAHRAIRDFEAVNLLAEQSGLRLIEDHTMPANNRLLVWQFCP